MGRVKLQIKKLESITNRQITYSKRKSGILKKAKELSVLCDIDIVLLMFSPAGKPTVFHGERSCIEEVISKFAQLTPQERTKRKLETLETLKKTFKKLDHDVNINEFLGSRNQTTEGLSNQLTIFQTQLMECHRRLSCWTNIDRIENTKHLDLLDESLRQSIERIQIHKEHYRKNQLLPIECTTTQFHNGIQLPLAMGGNNCMQEAHSLSWLPDNSSQKTILPGDSSFLPRRDMDGSIPVYPSCFFESTKPEDQICSISGQQFEHLQQGNGCLGLQQIKEEYSHPAPFNTTLGMEENQGKKMESEMELNNLQLPQQQRQGNAYLDLQQIKEEYSHLAPFSTTLGMEEDQGKKMESEMELNNTQLQQQQENACLDRQQIKEEYSHPTLFSTALDIEEDQRKKMESEMELNNLQLQQQGNAYLGLQKINEEYSHPTPFSSTLEMEEDQEKKMESEMELHNSQQQRNACLGLQHIKEEYSHPTPFGSTLGMEEDQGKKMESEMELNNSQLQQQQGNDCLDLQQIKEEYSHPTPFITTLGMEEDQRKKMESEMELNNLQLQQQQGNAYLGLQQINEEYSHPTPFSSTLGMKEDQEKKMESEMELHNSQQQQQDPLMYDPMASNNGDCFQIPHEQSMFATDHHHLQNWVPDSMLGQTSYNQQPN